MGSEAGGGAGGAEEGEGAGGATLGGDRGVDAFVEGAGEGDWMGVEAGGGWACVEMLYAIGFVDEVDGVSRRVV